MSSWTISVVVNASAKGVEKIKETPRAPAKRLSFIYASNKNAIHGVRIHLEYSYSVFVSETLELFCFSSDHEHLPPMLMQLLSVGA